MFLNENSSYKQPILTSTQQASVSAVLVDFISIYEGVTDVAKRSNIPKIKRLLHPAVDYVMHNLPDGVNRVDGNVITPLLNIAADYKLSLLPPLSSE